MTPNLKPAWFTVADAAKYSGLSAALLYELIKEDCIVSSTVLRPGRRRGRRLVQRASIDAFIEAGVGRSSADNLRGGASKALADPNFGKNDKSDNPEI
jgi:hypothetical protein